jgi:hypothetical protein
MAVNIAGGVRVEIYATAASTTSVNYSYRVVNSNSFAVRYFIANVTTGTQFAGSGGTILNANTTVPVSGTISGTQGGLSPGTTYEFRATVLRNSDSSFIVSASEFPTTFAALPGSVSNFSVTSVTETSINTSWTAASGATSYIMSRNGVNIAETSATGYTFTGLAAGTSYTLGVTPKNSAGNGPTSSITGTTSQPPPTQYTYTIFYNANGGSGSTPSTSVTTTSTSASLTVAANQFSRSGFSFSSWNTNSSGTGTTYFPGNTITLTAGSPSITLFAQWTSATPVFTDATITLNWFVGRNYSEAPDRIVTASPVTSYSIIYAGTGLSPLSWLTINSFGQLSGVPPQTGTYTFRVRATNSGVSTDTATFSLIIAPTGRRFIDSSSTTPISIARRFDGSSWVDLTILKRFDGTNWVDVTN